MDAVTAFLNGNIEEELYLYLPEEIESTLTAIVNHHQGNGDQVQIETAKKWHHLERRKEGNLRTPTVQTSMVQEAGC